MNLLMTAGKAVFIGITYDDNSYIDNHIEVWLKVMKPDENSYQILTYQNNRQGDRYSALLFATQVDLDNFLQWWEKYKSRFINQSFEDNEVPTIYEGQFIAGHTVKIGQVRNRYDRNLDWLWIVEHTTGDVLRFDDLWLFTDENEMMMFKLRVPSADAVIDDEEDIPF